MKDITVKITETSEALQSLGFGEWTCFITRLDSEGLTEVLGQRHFASVHDLTDWASDMLEIFMQGSDGEPSVAQLSEAGGD